MKLWRSWPKSPILRLGESGEKRGGEKNGGILEGNKYLKIFVNYIIWIFLLLRFVLPLHSNSLPVPFPFLGFDVATFIMCL